MSNDGVERDRGNSPPLVPSDSPGSSVSSTLQKEYSELLKYADVMTSIKALQDAATEETKKTEKADPARPVIGSEVEASTVEEDLDQSTDSGPSTGREERKRLSEFISIVNKNSNKDEDHLATPAKSRMNRHEMLGVPTSLVKPAMTEMGSKVDDWLGALKSNILDQFGQGTAMSLESLKQQHQWETEGLIQDKHRLEQEINRLSGLLNSSQESNTRKDRIIANLTQSYTTQRDRVKLARSFYLWQTMHMDAEREKFTTKIAEQFHEKLLAQRVFKSWFGLIQTRWKSRVERKCQTHAQELCLQLTTDYEAKITEMNKTMYHLEEKVKMLQDEKEQYSEQVKKAFMRGMCALNMEAMQAFGDDNPHDGFQGEDKTSNNNFESSSPYKMDPVSKTLPPTMEISSPVEVTRILETPQSFQLGQGQAIKNKTKTGSGKVKASTSAMSVRSSRPGYPGQGQTLAPPMASVVVERHQSVTKQTIGQATAMRFPKSAGSNHQSSSKPTRYSLGSQRLRSNGYGSSSQASMSRSHDFKPIAGQTLVSSIKLVE